MMVWKQLKAYLFLGLGLLVAALGLSTKYYSAKARKEKTKRKVATANLDHQVKVLKEDNVIEADFQSRRAAAKAEVDAGRDPAVFSDPNRMFDKPDNSD